MSLPQRPLVLVPFRVEGDAVVFFRGAEEVLVRGDAAFIGNVASRCDGMTALDDLLAALDLDDRDEGERVIGALAALGLVVDARRAFRGLHDVASLDRGQFDELTAAEVAAVESAPRWRPKGRAAPVAIDSPRTTLDDLLDRRRSAFAPGAAREFGAGDLVHLLSAAYSRRGSGHGSVPSAGGLYPLVVLIDLASDLPPLHHGLWSWSYERAQLAYLEPRRAAPSAYIPDPETADLADAAPAIVLVAGDLERASEKYANRAYLYAALEAGATMQNAYLAAAARGTGIRAIGGFLDDAVREAFVLPPPVLPLLVLAVGA